MGEVAVKTHLIITDTEHQYHIDWCGKIADAKPKFKNDKPIFVVISSKGRCELNTTDMKQIEHCAKIMTAPKGKKAIATDTARIFLKEENGNEKLMGILTHNFVKTFAPMFDKIEYI